ncbi:unnamed protein product [Ixodes persulcatus]
MKRETFEAMSTELLARAERSMAWALTVAGLRPTDVESVELVRGGVRVPAVKQLVRKLFQREPSTTLKQDEAVARGCALQCPMLSPIFEVRDFVVVDAQPYPIELCYDPGKGEDIWAEVFPRWHWLPFSEMLTFHRSKPSTSRPGTRRRQRRPTRTCSWTASRRTRLSPRPRAGRPRSR